MRHVKADPLQPFDPQERLEKEKKLTSDLGRAATKLQELLKTTQEQLAKEKDTVKKLQEQLDRPVSAAGHPLGGWAGLGAPGCLKAVLRPAKPSGASSSPRGLSRWKVVGRVV